MKTFRAAHLMTLKDDGIPTKLLNDWFKDHQFEVEDIVSVMQIGEDTYEIIYQVRDKKG